MKKHTARSRGPRAMSKTDSRTETSRTELLLAEEESTNTLAAECAILCRLEDSIGEIKSIEGMRALVSLATKDKSHLYQTICELTELVSDRTDVVDTIANAFLEYNNKGHIDIPSEKVGKMRQAFGGSQRLRATGPPRGPHLSPNITMADFIQHGQSFMSDGADAMHGTVPELSLVKDHVLEAIDNHLGIAGFRPNSCEQSSQASTKGVNVDFRAHVRVQRDVGARGFSATVCFAPLDSREDISTSSGPVLYNAVVCSLERLLLVHQKLRGRGLLPDRLVYFRTGTPGSFMPGVTTTASLDASILDELQQTVDSAGFPSLPDFDAMRIRRGWEFPFCDQIFRLGAVLYHGPVVDAILAGTTALWDHFAGNDWQKDFDKVIEDFQRRFWPFLQRLDLPFSIIPQGRAVSNLAPQRSANIVHRTALAVQFLSLIVQSYTPGRLEDDYFLFPNVIDVPISDFQLRGSDPWRPSILACRVPLLCSGGQSILVFQESHEAPKVLHSTLNTSLMDLLAMAPRFPPAVIHQKTTSDDSNFKLAAIVIFGGYAVPQCADDDERGDSPQRWTWKDAELANETDFQHKLNGHLLRLSDRINIDFPCGCLPEVQESSLITVTGTSTSALPMPGRTSTSSISSQNSGKPDTSDTYLATTKDEKDPHGEKSSVESPPTCPWEEQKPQDDMRKQMEIQERLRFGSYRKGQVSLDSIQFGVSGLEYLPLTFQRIHKFHPPYGLRDQMIRAAKDLEVDSILDFLNHDCGIIVSLHTGVMKRVYLRELVAYFASREVIDGASEVPREALDLLDSPDSSVNISHPLIREHKEALKKVTAQVIRKLQNSGGLTRRELVVEWPGEPFRQITIAEKEARFIAALADDFCTLTLASISHRCVQTDECCCRAVGTTGKDPGAVPQWVLPTLWRLKTTVYEVKPSSHGAATSASLEKGRLYWLGSGRSGLRARVLGFGPNNSGSDIAYLSVEPSLVPKVILKHLRRYNKIRESLGAGDIPCVIGSGKEFEREVYAYIEG